METPLRLRILVVEDDAAVREVFVAFFEMAGHEVVAAPDGHAGVVRALCARPHAATVDLDLPGLDGNDVARCLRRELGRDLILVAVTGRVEPADRQAALAAGFDLYLPKPVDAGRLVGIIEGAARRLRGCPACGETLVGPFPEHLRVCAEAASRAIERARRLGEQTQRAGKDNRQVRDDAALTRAESDALRDRSRRSRDRRRPPP